ncbi:tubulin-like doman-containing protein [Methylobacterium sp. NEAU 140]|uniref:tubulin-like doman-containing protein n=1 Tax=Methylobacterium sp. NEAU 140 TaxID=3064945 RepID=UPI0027322F92|nr:tubulin-like doman-containing protein [Methylobacterium sp. NEAU 140]MDP4025108.1 tubulin-like doman-containing protein [Methylobacterium sp. NEAU 140]
MADVGAGGTGTSLDIRLKLRPTVFVALGGTGMEVLLRLRRRILQADWNGARIDAIDRFPAAGFLYFDTDTLEAREQGRAAAADPLSAKVAFREGETLQKAVNLARYQAERLSYPHIDAWLPARDLSRIDASKGAGQIRAIARLLFFDSQRAFAGRLSAKGEAVLANMSNEAALRALGLDTATDLRVVVVASVAGGTGSGAVIDAGYAISSMETPKRPDAVDLFLVLPSGYVGANKDRVFANGVATLSELEYAMRGSPEPPYVERWGDHEAPGRHVERPFTDVYLFDTHNLADQRTSAVADLYDMMADVLFEDFGNSEFSGRKRSTGVNQTQHKLRKWAPPSPDAAARPALFSLNYSALGQATLATRGSLEFDAAAARTGLGMVEAFFGVARGQAERHIPTVEERDRFAAERLHLRFSAFEAFPKVIRPAPPGIPEYDLVGLLLQREDGASIQESAALAVEEAVDAIRAEIASPRDWAPNLRKAAERLRDDLLGRTGSGATYGPRGAEVREVRARIEAAWLSDGEGGLGAAVYRLLDDQERGGLDYALALIEGVKGLITAEDGALARLSSASDTYARLADEMLAGHFSDSLARLDQVRPGLFGSGRRDAERYLEQARDDLRGSCVLRVRAIAAREAAELLRRVSARLGERIGRDDETGRARHDGLLGALDQGHEDVVRLMGELRADIAEIRDAIDRPSGGTFLVLPSGDLPEIAVPAADTLAWAREAFRAYGGSRAIFALLREEETRAALLNAVRAMARGRLGPHRARIPAALDALRELPPAQQRETLGLMLARAMPWIQARFDAFQPTGDQFKTILAVEGARAFEAEFGPTLRAAMPPVLGTGGIAFLESSQRGRIVCYCELSGVPLDVLGPLRRDWRSAYHQELDRLDAIPLHNHKDYLRFPDPVAPTAAEAAALRETLSLFLRAACLGLLRRDPGTGLWRFAFEPGDWRSVGSERTLRRKLFDRVQGAALAAQVAEAEAALSPVQVLALAALFAWTAKRAYAPRRETVNYDAETRVGGVGHAVATALARSWTAAALRAGDLPGEGQALHDALLARIEDWTRPIPGSLGDVGPEEANRDPADPPALRALDKRAVDPARFTTAALLALAAPAPPAAVPPPPSSPPPDALFYLYRDGVEGPFALADLAAMARAGTLAAATQIHPQGGTWMPAGRHPALAPLLAPPPAPPAPPGVP